jgi:hypothetical protein
MCGDDVGKGNALGLMCGGLGRAPGDDAGLQPHAQMAQGTQHLADLRRFLALLDFGYPRLGRANRLRKLGLGQSMMPARRRDYFADFSSRLRPHAAAPYPIEYKSIYTRSGINAIISGQI